MDIWRYAAAAGAGAARARSLLAGSPVRPLHPAGRTFTAEVEVWGGGERHWGAGLLDIAGRHEATVRVSKGAGTPDGWPDVLGLAIRVAGAGATGPFDLLLSSTGRAPGLRHLPTPRRDFTATYGSILPYHGRRGRVWLAALPAPGVTAL
ncbi:MAG TPA: phosphodiesterase, partial [Pilimelia sp.]|nr:phosphodiesterase [Pilimelia sp.]